MARYLINLCALDGLLVARRLRDELIPRFGHSAVIVPGNQNLGSGTKWMDQLMATRPLVLLLITPDVFGAPAGGGPPRIDQPGDQLRLALEAALSLGVTVLPIEIDGTRLPPADQLPASLRPLAFIHHAKLGTESWAADIERLVHALQALESGPADLASIASPRSAPPVSAPAGRGGGLLSRVRDGLSGLFTRTRRSPAVLRETTEAPMPTTPTQPAPTVRGAPPRSAPNGSAPTRSAPTRSAPTRSAPPSLPPREQPMPAGAEPPTQTDRPSAPPPSAPFAPPQPSMPSTPATAVQADPIDSQATPVWFGAAAPRRSAPAQQFTARLVVYSDAARASAQAKLAALGEPDDRLLTDIAPDGDARWRIGAPVTVMLTGAHVRINPPQRAFNWNGRENLAAFEVSVAPDAPAGKVTLTFQVLLAGLPMAYLPLPLEIVAASAAAPSAEPVAAPGRPAPRSAFASYSSKDAQEVTGRLSSLQRWAPTLAIFQDCLDLQPNEAFKPQLERQITERDVFLLFWSRHAAASKWVHWEYDTARQAKGLDAIVAMPLEDPSIVKPPPEFAEAHMRDRFMMARYALQEIRDQASTLPPAPGAPA